MMPVPVMNEHLGRIKKNKTKKNKTEWHYFSSQIQNKIVALIGDKVLDEIVRRVKKAT